MARRTSGSAIGLGGGSGLASAGSVRLEIEGVAEVRQALEGIRASVQRRILKNAVGFAIKPLLPAVRAKAPSAFGTLKRSMVKVVKSYKAAVVALVGPDTKYTERVTGAKPFLGPRMGVTRVQRPANYIHLIEGGVSPHFISAPGYGKKGKLGPRHFNMISTPGWRHPGFAARPFVAETAQALQATVVKRFTERVKKRVTVEYERAKRTGRKYFATDTEGFGE